MMTDDRPTPEQQHSQQFHMPSQQVTVHFVSIFNMFKKSFLEPLIPIFSPK